MIDPAPQPPSRHKLPVWLIASVLANALLVGVIAGHALAPKPDRHGGPRGPAEMRLVREIVREAAPQDRAAIRRAFATAMRDSAPLREDRNAARAAVADAMAVEPYDEAAVRAAFADLRAADDALRATIQDTLAEQLAGAGPEARAALAEAMKRGPRGARRPFRERRGEGGPR